MADLILDGITLSDGLLWSDEFDYTPVKQNIKTMLDGSQLIQEGVAQAGRPITLQGTEQRGWVKRSALEQLFAKLTIATPMALSLPDGRSFNVRWRHNDKPIDAKSLQEICVPAPDQPYAVTLRLMTA